MVGKLTDEGLKSFGHSKEFTKTAERILTGLSGKADCPQDLSSSAEAANQVADCSYECGTSWGTKVSCKTILNFERPKLLESRMVLGLKKQRVI